MWRHHQQLCVNLELPQPSFPFSRQGVTGLLLQTTKASRSSFDKNHSVFDKNNLFSMKNHQVSMKNNLFSMKNHQVSMKINNFRWKYSCFDENIRVSTLTKLKYHLSDKKSWLLSEKSSIFDVLKPKFHRVSTFFKALIASFRRKSSISDDK